MHWRSPHCRAGRVRHHRRRWLQLQQDGDLFRAEGISQEAISLSLAGLLKLGRMIAFREANSISIDGATSLAVSDDELQRVQASGWHVLEIDGHGTDAIRTAIVTARSVTDQPI